MMYTCHVTGHQMELLDCQWIAMWASGFLQIFLLLHYISSELPYDQCANLWGGKNTILYQCGIL